MTLQDVLDVISGGTHIIIYDGTTEVFNNRMCEVSKFEWDQKMDKYLNKSIIRINAINNAVIIAV